MHIYDESFDMTPGRPLTGRQSPGDEQDRDNSVV
jgi:hypothetical protein